MFKTLIRAFVSSRLDYRNSAFAGVSGQLLHRLQVTENAAGHLVIISRRHERMTPVLHVQFTLATDLTTDH